ncbi:hypothetical protein TKK_0003053 [Trichogramma kaykai]
MVWVSLRFRCADHFRIGSLVFCHPVGPGPETASDSAALSYHPGSHWLVVPQIQAAGITPIPAVSKMADKLHERATRGRQQHEMHAGNATVTGLRPYA